DNGRVIPGADALRRAGLAPIRLGPKEGLALINGTQPSTAVLALALAAAEQLARAADVAAALSTDALRGAIHPLARRAHHAPPICSPPQSCRWRRSASAGPTGWSIPR